MVLQNGSVRESPSLVLSAAFDGAAWFGAWYFLHFWARRPKATPYQLAPHSVYLMENERGLYFNISRMYSRAFGECLLWRLKCFYLHKETLIFAVRMPDHSSMFSLRCNWQLLRHRECLLLKWERKVCSVLCINILYFAWLSQSDLY